MNEVKMKKSELIETLEYNQEKHIADFEIALNGWQEDYKAQLKESCQLLDGWGGVSVFRMADPRPKSYSDDYDTMISMLKSDVRDEIELAPHEFKQYVLDQWSWSGTFALSNSKYMS